MDYKEFEKAVKAILCAKPTERAKYENKRPTKKELNQKFKLKDTKD